MAHKQFDVALGYGNLCFDILYRKIYVIYTLLLFLSTMDCTTGAVLELALSMCSLTTLVQPVCSDSHSLQRMSPG